ncbi:MAG: Holliday junction resolvase RuvX [Anaerolineales bacterium]
MIILAVDPGQKRIGIAITDPSGKVALPLTILEHISRLNDAQRIVQIAVENNVSLILIGQALDSDNMPTLQSRRSVNLANSIRALTSIPVELWEEYESSQMIKNLQAKSSPKHKTRRKAIDDLAAVVILQNYLESHA